VVRARIAAALACAVLLAVACSLDHADLSNKACPCGSDYACDTARNVCVLSGELDASADATPGCSGQGCACNVDGDCVDPDYRRCSAKKTCVACVQSPDSCPVGSYCNDDLVCTLGCKGDADCKISPTSPHCNATRHECVECTTAGDCSGGKQCSPSGVCAELCDPDAGIACTAAGKSCCNGFCIDTTSDLFNCGGCGTKCSAVNGTPKCTGSACTWTCASGFAHCNSGNTGCDTNIRTTTARCGSCNNDCTSVLQHANAVSCSAGTCAFTTCVTNFGDCDGNRGNGCECGCGAVPGDRCCPGNVCNFPGGKCVGGGTNPKCQ